MPQAAGKNFITVFSKWRLHACGTFENPNVFFYLFVEGTLTNGKEWHSV